MLGHAFHAEPNKHAERLLGLVDEVLRQAGATKSSLERVAVSVGPGSFTGVRVGLSLSQGLTLALGILGVGVGSLRALAASAKEDTSCLRVAVRDARRDEDFVAIYDAQGQAFLEPRAVPKTQTKGEILALVSGQDFVVLGREVEGLPFQSTTETGDPDATQVALLGADADPTSSPLVPDYLRGPNLVRPSLPDSPLNQPRKTL